MEHQNRSSRDNRRRGYQETYIEGNAVRRANAVPEYQPQRREKTQEEIRRDRERYRAVRRNRQNALSMNFGYVCFLTVATVICAVVCAVFVHVQSDITTRMETITTLESQIAEQKADNTATEKRIETAMNLNQVKKKAKALGLTYPSSKQIQYYSVKNSDYMNQYGDIPSK